MARMPQADWLGEHAPVQSNGKRRTMDRYDIVCVHTIVGFAPAHAAHFSTHQGGTIQQSRDTAYQSGANLEGNHRVIAIESEDHGSAFPNWNTRDGHAVPALTDDQVEANAQILAWAHREHGVPLQLCPDSRPGSRGLAYHRQGIDGNWSGYRYGGRVSGGETWTTSPGKVCPGDRRIDQLPAILARAKDIVEGDDDMTRPSQWTDHDWYLFRQNATHSYGANGYRNPPDENAGSFGEVIVALSDSLAGDVVEHPGNPGKSETIATSLHLLRQDSNQHDGRLAQILANQQAIMAAQGVEVDEAALAQQISAVLVPAVIDALPDTGLTEAEVEDASERAVRAVLGSLDAD